MIILVSGGLDSFISWKFLKEPKCLFVNYGQEYFEQESAAVKNLYPNVEFIDIGNLPKLGNEIHVPARNLMLATLALRYSNNIYFGGVKDEQCSDKSPRAFQEMSKILTKHSSYNVVVNSTLWQWTKSQAVAEYLSRGYEKDDLLKTVSCYSREVCNNCESCFRRSIALAVNGIVDKSRIPTESIIHKFINEIHLQPAGRARDIVIGLKKMGVDISVVKLGGGLVSKFNIVMTDRSSHDRLLIKRQLPKSVGLLTDQMFYD